MNFDFPASLPGSSSSHSQSISALALGLNFWYHAKTRTKTVKPIKYGLKGSIHEKVDAKPVVPANTASTGVIQHIDAPSAVRTEVPINFLFLIIPQYFPFSINLGWG